MGCLGLIGDTSGAVGIPIRCVFAYGILVTIDARRPRSPRRGRPGGVDVVGRFAQLVGLAIGLWPIRGQTVTGMVTITRCRRLIVDDMRGLCSRLIGVRMIGLRRLVDARRLPAVIDTTIMGASIYAASFNERLLGNAGLHDRRFKVAPIDCTRRDRIGVVVGNPIVRISRAACATAAIAALTAPIAPTIPATVTIVTVTPAAIPSASLASITRGPITRATVTRAHFGVTILNRFTRRPTVATARQPFGMGVGFGLLGGFLRGLFLE